MYFWITPIRRPALQIFQNCVCQKSVYSQKTVLSQLRIQVSFFNNKYFMSGSSNVNKNPLIPDTSLLQHKKIELTPVSNHNASSSSENQQPTEVQKLSNKDKLKRAVKDYGATVIVFHVTISLMSLGISYLVISSGVDVGSLLSKVGLDTQSTLAAGASTFVVAYAVHKVFAPVRISITLGATPFIVKYLRRIGVLKPPKS